ncbi:hypothetical protein ACLUXD_06195 [Loigolactobacillus coryniformis subsp. coryniformis]|uniref:hypothetical protein n=1 Tax=Loigolactobacillus coryniformis TaxID=1610 RepID=UPI0015B62533
MLKPKVPTAIKQNAQVNRTHDPENIHRMLTRTNIQIDGHLYPRKLGKFGVFLHDYG